VRIRRGITGRTAAVVVVALVVIGGLGFYGLSVSQPATLTTTVVRSSTVTAISTSTSTSLVVSTVTRTPQQNYTFKIMNLVGSSGLDPQFAVEPTIVGNMYNRLIVVALNGSVLPDLATSWSVTSNGTQWTFKLRQGVTFHDGTSFNSTDVKFTYDRLKSLPLGQGTVKAVIKSVSVVDPLTVVFNTPQPVPLPLYLASEASTWVVSHNAFALAKITQTANATADQLALKAWFDSGHDDGTGPYTVVPSLYDAQNSVTLVRFNSYWGGWKANQASTVIFNVVSSPTLAVQELAAAQADFFGSPTVDQVPLLKGSKARIINASNVAVQMLWFNVNSSQVANPILRQALAYAIPYSTIISNVYGGFATKAVGWVAPGVFGHDNGASAYSYNLTKAQALLQQAGYSGGVVSPSITLRLLLYSLYPETQQTWALIQAEWAKLGVNLQIQAVGPTQLIGILKGTNPPDVLGLRWSPSCLSAGCQLRDNWGSTSFVNFANFKNSTFDSLVSQALSVEGGNPTQSQQLFSQAQAVIYAQTPGVVMVNLQTLFVLNSQWSVNPSALAFDPNPISNTIFVYGFVHA